MKKKKKTKAKVSRKNITPDLPQNILAVGERVFDDKNIYIHQKVYAQIHKFAANKTENEHGGILVGRVLNEMGKENTIIEGFIEAKYNAATPTTLTFTHETWEHFHSELDRKYKDKKIVGWIHTHPNFGIFLSENDKFIQENYFTDVNQVAYVVDPIQKDEGFYFWVDEKLERCPGFYLFDKNGVKIKQQPWSSDSEENDKSVVVKSSKLHAVVTAILAIAIIANIFVMMAQSSRIAKLEEQVEDQNLVLKYCIFGQDVSIIADEIKVELAEQERLQQEALRNNLQQKAQQSGTDGEGQVENAPSAETAEPTAEENGGQE